jgi:hypothetical protein
MSDATAAILPFRPRVLRYAHEFTCRGCGHQVHCSVHWGPIDLCHFCRDLTPEVHRALLAGEPPCRSAQA